MLPAQPLAWFQRVLRVAVVALAATALLGCSYFSKAEINETQARAALEKFVDARNPVCQTFFVQWPVQVTDYERRNHSYHAQRLEALEAVGLVGHQVGAVLPKSVQNIHKANSKDFIATKVYRLSDLGKQAYKAEKGADAAAAGEGKFCYASKAITRIVSLSPVNTQGKEPTAVVTYVYELKDLAPWASDAKIQEVFPTIAREVAGLEQERKMHLRLRNKAWEVDPIASLD